MIKISERTGRMPSNTLVAGEALHCPTTAKCGEAKNRSCFSRTDVGCMARSYENLYFWERRGMSEGGAGHTG